jgi:hypothetical protein
MSREDRHPSPPASGRGRGNRELHDRQHNDGPRVQSWGHDGQVVLSCGACDWQTLVINANGAELETQAHTDSPAHRKRLSESVEPSS